MRILFALIVALPWLIVPVNRDAFLVPKTVLAFTGMVLVIFYGLTRPAVPLSRWKNQWLCWTAAVLLIEMAVRFYWKIIFWSDQDSQIPFEWFSVLPTIYLLMAFLFVITLSRTLLTDFTHRFLISRWICLTALSVSIYALLQYLGLDPMIRSEIVKSDSVVWGKVYPYVYMTTFLGNVSYTSMYLALTAPLFLMFKSRRYLLYLGVVLGTIILSGRLYAIAAAGVSLLAYGILRFYHRTDPNRAWSTMGLLAFVVAATGCLAWSHAGRLIENERWGVWRLALSQWYNNSFFGYGIGGFAQRFFVDWEKTKLLLSPTLPPNSRWLWMHTDVGQWLYETGLVGMVPMALMGYQALKSGFRKSSSVLGSGYCAACIGLLVMSTIAFPWHFAPTAILGLLIWSMCETEEEIV